MRRSTVVIADDHPIARRGVRALLGDQPDLVVVGEEGDGLKVLELVERTKPDVLVLDLLLPGLAGIDVLRHVLRRVPKTRVVVLSMNAAEAYVLAAMQGGAAAYVVKEAIDTELLKAVREAVAGRRYLSPPFSEQAIASYLARATQPPLDLLDTLTAREREVLRLAAGGLTTRQIAARLSISQRTAETHRANFMRKLRLRNQTELVRYAMGRGILPHGDTAPPRTP